MNYSRSDEHRLLQDQVRALLTERAPADALRRLMDSGMPWDPALGSDLAELGFLGAGIPEAYGGVGLGPREVAVIMEEIGRRVAPIPFFSSIAVVAEAIVIAGSEAQREKWLPGLATGDRIGTFAFSGDVPGAGCRARRQEAHPPSCRLSGRRSPVPDGANADLCLVDLPDGLAIVDLNASGIVRLPLDGFDQLRRHSAIVFSEAAAEPLDGSCGGDGLDALLDRAAVYQAFEQVGGAEAALEMARDYSMRRYIFGRPLASYQATKHKLAEILIEIELARSLALAALTTLAEGGDGLRQCAAAARLSATRAYEDAARENLQVHGGIGFTWEADVHLHLRRARLLALNLGSAEAWTDRLIDALADEVGPASADGGRT